MLSLKIYNFCFKHAKLWHFQIRKQLEHLDNHGEDIYIGNFEATRARGSWLDLYKTFLYTLSFFSYWHQCFNILLINTFFWHFSTLVKSEILACFCKFPFPSGKVVVSTHSNLSPPPPHSQNSSYLHGNCAYSS